MSDKLTAYRRAGGPLPDRNRLWPLYGAGLENIGREGRPIEVPMPQYGPDELLVRHDACGLCFSDIKVIRLGEEHPRIYRDMQADPVVLGHEVILTVVGVGHDLRDQYRVGDRFIIQADIYVGGVNYAYGYEWGRSAMGMGEACCCTPPWVWCRTRGPRYWGSRTSKSYCGDLRISLGLDTLRRRKDRCGLGQRKSLAFHRRACSGCTWETAAATIFVSCTPTVRQTSIS